MGRTLEELGASMSAAEFSLWLALYQKAPWDETRFDLGVGIIASQIANFAGRMLPEAVFKSPVDYMPFVDKPAEPPEPDPMEFFGKL